MKVTEQQYVELLAVADMTWGPHPLDWLPPLKRPPRWWQTWLKWHETEFNLVFGMFCDIDQEARDAFYAEQARGQSAYEDAGGFRQRCYRAMLGLPVDAVISMETAIRMAGA